jgi:hypothetical protein
MNALASLPALPQSPCWDLDREVIVISLVKALTDAVERMGYGGFLAEPEVSHVRARLYALAGIEDWSSWMDREAAGRLKLWLWKIRIQEEAAS